MRLNLVLLLGILASALYLVRVQYQSRWLYAELYKAQSEEKRLLAENDRLQVEIRLQSNSARVEKIAKEKLQMRTASPTVTTYVTFNAMPGHAP